MASYLANEKLPITDILPRELLEKILSNVSYEEISNLRHMCVWFDKSCQALLNQGFNKVDKFHAQIQREVKAKLPRRESERRNHPLARHVDILAAIETRLSLLSMTYTKYIDSGVCCFIPGKVLDELYRVLWRIRTDSNPPRAHELLQELRDISSMAMEHFDEHIAPDLKNKMPPMQLSLNTSLPGPSGVVFNSASPLSVSYTVQPQMPRHPGMRNEIAQVKANVRGLAAASTSLRKDMNESKSKIHDQAKKIMEQDKKLLDQNRMIAEQNRKIGELNTAISELTSKLLAQEQKMNQLIVCNSLKEDKTVSGGKKGSSVKQESCADSGDISAEPAGAKMASRKRKADLIDSASADTASKTRRRHTRTSARGSAAKGGKGERQ